MKRYVISSWYEPDEPPYDIENYEIELYFEDTLVTVEADGTTKIDYDFSGYGEDYDYNSHIIDDSEIEDAVYDIVGDLVLDDMPKTYKLNGAIFIPYGIVVPVDNWNPRHNYNNLQIEVYWGDIRTKNLKLTPIS